MTNIEKINFLLNQVEDKLHHTKVNNDSPNNLRKNNLNRVALLYAELELEKKHPDFSTIFNYKAMNLAGIGLKNEDLEKFVRVNMYRLLPLLMKLIQMPNALLKTLHLATMVKLRN